MESRKEEAEKQIAGWNPPTGARKFRRRQDARKELAARPAKQVFSIAGHAVNFKFKTKYFSEEIPYEDVVSRITLLSFWRCR